MSRPVIDSGIRAEVRALTDLDFVIEAKLLTDRLPAVRVRVLLDMSSIHGVEGGLPVGSRESVVLSFPQPYPAHPPLVRVRREERFIGYPHVLLGEVLCIYLDPSREWNGTYGLQQALQRTMEWFDNAANDRFDPRTSLFHAIGGVSPATVVVPMIVLRDPPPVLKSLSEATLALRGNTRIDLTRWQGSPASPSEVAAIVLNVPSPLPLGLERNLADLARQVDDAGGSSSSQIEGAIRRRAEASPPGSPAFVCVVVAHPTEHDLPTVVLGMIGASTCDEMKYRPNKPATQVQIDWMPMSDERADVTTRRDHSRPAAAFQDKVVEIWGCGGLGSWIAEFITRTRPAKVTLRDGGQVHRGLLVRQDYTEGDVGMPKAPALKARLEGLSDITEIVLGGPSAEDAMADDTLPGCDVVIDATINEAVRLRLDAVASASPQHPLLVEVSLDRPTATLGIAVVAAPDSRVGPATVDRELEPVVLADANLETYHDLFRAPPKGSELTPAPGCSTPTYHGSAADLGVIAGSMVSIIGQQLVASSSGLHLVAAPYSGHSPAHRFIPRVIATDGGTVSSIPR